MRLEVERGQTVQGLGGIVNVKNILSLSRKFLGPYFCSERATLQSVEQFEHRPESHREVTSYKQAVAEVLVREHISPE